ncbi:MAG: M48 family metallopeptidase [Bryobacterales bacterium]|nr:M48 family metallopeptidase [Bryobacterales bacterium]
MIKSRFWARVASTLVLSAALVLQPAVSLAQTKIPKPGFNFFSKDQDIQLGKEAAAQVDREMPILHNAELDAWLRKLAEPLISQPEAGGYPFQFHWVNDDSINAFALPGGPVYMNIGVLKNADDEGQVVGVLAHEISHVALRHGTNQVSKANLFSIPAMIGGAMLGDNSLLGQLGQLGIGVGLNSVLLKYSRGAESQADEMGAILMHRAGYNPIEMANFFEKLQALSGKSSTVANWFSTHPDPGNRVKAIQKEILTFDKRSYNRDTGEFARMKAIAAKLPPPPKQAPGGAAAPSQTSSTATIPPLSELEPPSSRFKSFQSSMYTVSYPENWQASQGEQGSYTILPKYGIVDMGNGGSSIGYGSIITERSNNSSQRFEEAASVISQEVIRNNPGLQLTEEPQRILVNGKRSILYMMNGPSAFQGQREDVVLVVIERSASDTVSVIFVAPDRDFSRFEPTFKNMLSSVRIR